MKRLLGVSAASFCVAISLLIGAGSVPPDIEVGTVKWERDLDKALASSKASGKPVFALFQEVPGCAGCKQFGKEVLSSPLVVEAIESEFTPLLIHNNKPGKDAEVLERFQEPAWNYQVVRFLNGKAEDIIPRRDRVWDSGGIMERMITTLETAKRPVPAYLSLAVAETSPRLKQAAFSMFCFWSGEMILGQLDGVLTTNAGFIDGREVVLVGYDPTTVPLPKLIAAAKQNDFNYEADITKFRAAPASDQKKQLSGTVFQKLNLTAAQFTKVNAWLRVDANKALACLAPSQKARVK